MESKVEDTSTFSALPQEEQQELEQTLSQNSKHVTSVLALFLQGHQNLHPTVAAGFQLQCIRHSTSVHVRAGTLNFHALTL